MAIISSKAFIHIVAVPVDGCDQCAILTDTLDQPTACSECIDDQYEELMKREAEQKGKNHG